MKDYRIFMLKLLTKGGRRCANIVKKTLEFFVFLGDITFILLIFIYIITFHLLSLGSFLFEGYPDEKINIEPSHWILQIIIVGTILFIYIKYLWGTVRFKKLKIYLLMIGFSTSILLNTLWTILSYSYNDLNNLLVQLLVLGTMVLVLFYANSRRKRLVS
jgi:hypothetical protein